MTAKDRLMLVTFRTKAYANITLFGDVAVQLLNMMGHSGSVPGAIKADDVPGALARLRAALAGHKAARGADEAAARQEDDEQGQPAVTLEQRAFPLIALLEAAAARQCDVMWGH